MPTNFKSQEVIANLNSKDLFTKFTDLNNLKDYLPSDVEEFESNTNNCSFKIESLPKMSLRIKEKQAFKKIKFESIKSQIPFNMLCYISENDKSSSKVSIEICMELNFMMKMLVQKPINIFLDRFTEIIKNTKSSIEIKKKMDEIKKDSETPSVGSLAPEFTGPDLFAEPVSLSDVKSKVILLDFWASWCAPCRVENPSLVNLKSKYSDDEFQIIGVSLDRDMESWINAIESDNIKDWVHVSNLKFWGEPIAKQYKVTQMPTTFVLDESKKIIGVDVKGDDLDAMIALQLSK